MFRDKAVMKQMLTIYLFEIIAVGIMLGVYAVFGRFTMKVLYGALIGAGLSMLNFFFLSLSVSKAANKAETGGETAKATLSIQSSSIMRRVLLLVVYILILRKKFCSPIAAVLPLVFLQLSISMLGLIHKDGVKQ